MTDAFTVRRENVRTACQMNQVAAETLWGLFLAAPAGDYVGVTGPSERRKS
jgi:hypothetical protein